MPSINEIKNYTNEVFNVLDYVKVLNDDSKSKPIFTLIKEMDSNDDKVLTSDEVYQGLLNNCSDKLSYVNFAGSVVNKFDEFTTSISNFLTPKNKSITAELEPNQVQQNELDKNLQALGIDLSQVRGSIDNYVGENGININNITDTISSFAGTDVNAVLAEAKKYGLDINLETLSINDIIDLANRAENALNVIEDFESIKKDFNNGNIWSCITSLPDLISKGYDLYKNEPIAREYINKLVGNFLCDSVLSFGRGLNNLRSTQERQYEEELFRSGNVKNVANYELSRWTGGGL